MESERRNGREARPSDRDARARGKGHAGASGGNAGNIKPDETLLQEPEGTDVSGEASERRTEGRQDPSAGAAAAGTPPARGEAPVPGQVTSPDGADGGPARSSADRRPGPGLELVGGRSASGAPRAERGSHRSRGRSGSRRGSSVRTPSSAPWPGSRRSRDGRGVALLVVLAVSVAAYFLFTSLSPAPPEGDLPGEGIGPAADGGSGPAPGSAGSGEPDTLPGTPGPDDEQPSGAHLVDGSEEDSDSVPASVTGPPEIEELVWPLAGRMSSGFGWVYSDTMADWRYHRGIDISAEEGDAIRAVHPGTVTDVRLDGAWGWVLEIEHSPGYSTLYAGSRRVFVERGDEVEAGQQVAQVGSTAMVEGGAAPHLHLEMTWGGTIIDPLEVLVGEAPETPDPTGAP